MATITVNGRTLDAPAGEKLLPVLLDAGVRVPHYCWHRGLSPAGNCRMCLVKVNTSRKLEVACMLPVADKLEVVTEGPDVDAGRQAVLEYMLINHPLDCPVCDKAGECDLQDYTFQYRRGVSRFDENKVIKHTKDLGPNVKIWGNRCISCTRCVRFTEEITGTGELTISARGDHSAADVHPDVPLDNPMSLNVVDICPVGALIDKNFLYQARVWFTQKGHSICPGCSRGCNIQATVMHDDIKRIRPRANPDVNGFWMCDAGRLGQGWIASKSRLRVAKGAAVDVAARCKAVDDAHGAGSVALVVATSATIEELYLVRKLATALRATVAFATVEKGDRWVSKSGFAIETDKTPNVAGAREVFGLDRLPGTDAVTEGIAAGRIHAVVVINGLPDLAVPSAWATARLEFRAALDVLESEWTRACRVVLPSASWAEKAGTWKNRDGRLQRIARLLSPPGAARPDIAPLQEMLVALGQRKSVLSAEAVFREAMPGIDPAAVGPLGLLAETAGVAK
jgi:NADH-quinone oxidoreductase subunit G